MTKSLLKDLIVILFSPKRFFKERFLKIESKPIFILSFISVFLGLLVGNIFNLIFSHIMIDNFIHNKEVYLTIIHALQLTEQSFIELLKIQKAYALLLIILSPLISYMAPHLFGGALFIFIRLLIKPKKVEISFFRVMECAAISLTSFAYYMLPIFGPLIALILVGVNLSRALLVQYEMAGFLKVASILSAMYVCFFLSSATLQLLATPLAAILK